MVWARFAAFRSRLSLRARIGLVLLVSFLAFESGSLYLSFSIRAADLRLELSEGGHMNVGLIERTVAEQAVIGDYAAIRQALEACANGPSVKSVVFTDVQGKTVEAIGPARRNPPPEWLRKLARLDVSPIVGDVHLGGVRYGSLSVKMDPAPGEARLYRGIVTQTSITAAFVAAMLALSWLPLRSNLSVLLRLQHAAQRFASGDYRARVALSSDNTPELREAAGAFNTMGGRIGGLLTALSEQTRAVDNAAILLEADLEGVITSVNGRYRALMGDHGAGLPDRRLPELLAVGRPEVSPAREWESVVSGRSWRGEVPIESAQGRKIWLDLTVTLIRTADECPEKILAIGFDITEKRRTTEALRESRQMLRLVLDNIPQLVFWKDRHLVYLGCNRNFSEAAGAASPDAIVGRTDFDFPWKDTEAEAYRKDDRDVMETGKPKLKFIETQLMASGKLAYVETSKVPLQDADGNVVGVLGTYEDITERRAVEKRIEYLAYYDGLTGLPNRTLLEDRLSQAIRSAERHGKPFAVLFLDLDGFKAVNDRLGHDRGDEFLKEMGLRLGRAVRSGDTVARLGGDEFVLLLVDLVGREDAEEAIERVLEVIRAPVVVEGLPLSVTATVGVAFYPDDDLDGDALLRHADIAMYQAKGRGRDRYLFFDREMAREMTADHRERERIAGAFRRDEFHLFFQPTVNMRTGAVIGMEALLRWDEGGRGLMRVPGEFLPAIEGTDLIVEVGDWVLEEALSRLESWCREGLDLRVGVNVAARQIQHRRFLETVQGALARHPSVSPQRLEMEILETTALDDIGVVQGVMAKCREIGVRFCLDDFGTGYSSLSYLKRLPVDVVKIDQGFVRDMLEDREDLAIIESILSMSAIFGREVVAEGVSVPEQGLMLLRLGCDLAQGFGIARPMPGVDVPGWVGRWRPDPAWALLADSRWRVDDFPLMMAAQEHFLWVERVLQLVGTPEGGSGKTLTLNSHCRLGRWLEGPGQEKYGRLPAFREAWRLHGEVHEVALRLGKPSGPEEADPLRARLVTLRDGLLERLGSLDGVRNERPT